MRSSQSGEGWERRICVCFVVKVHINFKINCKKMWQSSSMNQSINPISHQSSWIVCGLTRAETMRRGGKENTVSGAGKGRKTVPKSQMVFVLSSHFIQETMNSAEFPALAAPIELDAFSMGWAGVELDFLCVSTSVVSAPSRWLFSCCCCGARSADLVASFLPWLLSSAWKSN